MKSTETKKIIWTNNIDIDDWKDDIKADFEGHELTESDIWNIASEMNNDYLEDEKMNLNKPLGRDLVIIARLGLWDGPRNGWKHIKGSNLNNVFDGTCGDYVTWYVEDGDICCEDCHHDGTNYYKYRAIRKDLSPWEFDELMAEGKDVDELTEKLGHYVSEIYGW